MDEPNLALDAVNDIHSKIYTAVCSSAFAGGYVFGVGYDKRVVFTTWLEFDYDMYDTQWITKFNIHYNGSIHHYKGMKGWMRTINRLTFSTDKVYWGETNNIGTATLIDLDKSVA